LNACNQGRRRNYWVYKYYCERSERKESFGLYPTYDILGYNICKETGEPIGQRYPGICLLQYFDLLVMHL